MIHLYGSAQKMYGEVQNWFCERATAKKRLSEIIQETASVILNSDLSSYKGFVYLFQHSYYTRDGKQYISGGGERYASDLAVVMASMGYKPFIVQMGLADAEKCWTLERGTATVIGVRCNEYTYPRILCNLPVPTLTIYSGFVDFGKKLLSPNIMISHGITWDNPYTDVDTAQIKTMLNRIDGLVSVDTNTLSWLRSTYSESLSRNRKNLRYIPNYTDLTIYRPLEEKRRDEIKIVFPRRCSPERGFWLVNEILPELMDQFQNIIFEFVGFLHTEEIEKTVRRLISQYPGRVFHRVVEADRMYEVYQDADITLIPTLYSEGTSLSCIEAMASGNAVIATNIGGLPNLIINEYNGLLINPEGKELLNALSALIKDAEYRKRLANRAIEVAQVFSKDNWVKQWQTILKEYLEA